ncbi:MAG TPA: APC family permease [Verrucomicrobiae bacterium]|nr:APC family permease [Verrucomicrobiae bacterium]
MQEPELRSGSLTFVEVLATSVALIGPSMTPILIAPYMFANAGNGTWLAYLFGGVMLIFVALNLNQFARRSTGAGSMYEYVAEQLGPLAGSIAGWTLLWAYVFVAAAVLGAMAFFVDSISAHHVATYLTVVLVAAVCWQAAYRGVQISAILMLVLEAISVSIILVLVGIVLARHPSIDTAQLTLHGGIPSWGLAVATAVFSLVGFESATAFGAEAKRPLVTIPRAVIWSVVLASAFFMLTTYAEIVGVAGSGTTLDKLDAPLVTIAGLLHADYLRVPIFVGAFCSAFSVLLACVTTAGRIAFAMARARAIPEVFAQVEPRHDTPHVSVTVVTAIVLGIAAALLVAGIKPIDVFNNCGTLSSCGFILIYAMIALAAIALTRRAAAGRFAGLVVGAVAIVLLAVPAVTLFYPLPPPPQDWLPYLFLIYLTAGALWFTILHRRRTVRPS